MDWVASIRHEDGKLDLYDYSLVTNLWVETVTHLHEQSPAPVSGKTTREVTFTNARGEILEQKTEAFIDGIWYTIARNRMTYNSQGKRITSENLAGQVTTTAWDGWSVTYNGENRPVRLSKEVKYGRFHCLVCLFLPVESESVHHGSIICVCP